MRRLNHFIVMVSFSVLACRGDALLGDYGLSVGAVPDGDVFPDAALFGKACDGFVYVQGMTGYAICANGVWGYTTDNPVLYGAIPLFYDAGADAADGG